MKSFYLRLSGLLCMCMVMTNAYAQQYEGLRHADLGDVQLYSSKITEFEGVRVGLLCRDANDYFKEVLDELEVSVNLLFLNDEDWDKHGITGLIYGMPHFKASENAIVSASDDNDFWRMQIPDIGTLPRPLQESFMEAYGREDEVSVAGFFQLLSIHELGHIWSRKGGRAIQRLWLEEVFCNLALHTYIAEAQPERLSALETLPYCHAMHSGITMQYTSLEVFEKDYYKIGMEAPHNYGWYQFRFHHAAGQIYNEGGADVLKKLWDFLGKYPDKLSDEELEVKLAEEVHPYFGSLIKNW